jgi:hypothetical protein
MAVLGRLAVDRAWQGRGLGRLLLRDALLGICQAAAIAPVRVILVHALSPPAKRFIMATAPANRQKTRGRFSSRCRPPPLRCGMYKPKTPVPAPGFLRLCIELSRGRLAPEQAQPGVSPRSSTPIVGALSDPAPEV